MARAKTLKYQGEWIERRDPEGNVIVSGPSQSFPGIPARDLTDEDIAALDDDQYRDATVSGLYVDPDAKKSSGAGDSRTVAALRAEAKARGLSAPKSAKKADLVALLAEPANAEEASAQQAENVAAADEDVADGGDADGPRSES